MHQTMVILHYTKYTSIDEETTVPSIDAKTTDRESLKLPNKSQT